MWEEGEEKAPEGTASALRRKVVGILKEVNCERRPMRVQCGAGRGGGTKGETGGVDGAQIIPGFTGQGKMHACNQMHLCSHIPKRGCSHTQPCIILAHMWTHVLNMSTHHLYTYINIYDHAYIPKAHLHNP